MTDELIIPAGYQVIDVFVRTEGTSTSPNTKVTLQVKLDPRVAARAKQFARRAQELHLPRRLRTRWKPTKHPAWVRAAVADQKRTLAQAGIKGKVVGHMHDSIVLSTPPHSAFDYAQDVARLDRLRTTVEIVHMHTDRGKEIACAAFAPRPDLGLVKADLTEVELRSLEKPT